MALALIVLFVVFVLIFIFLIISTPATKLDARTEVEINSPFSDTFSKCIDALNSINAKITHQSASEGYIQARHIKMTSRILWGMFGGWSDIRVTVTKKSENRSLVTVASKPLTPLNIPWRYFLINPYGRNIELVKRIVEAIK
jgi:hypothetical protein